MEFNNFRPELHVAQQSRRDRLRVLQQSSAPHQGLHLEDYPSNLGQLSALQQGLNPDLIQLSRVRYGNLSYNPAMFSSEMTNFAPNPQVSGDPLNCGTWKNVGSQPSCDWNAANYSSRVTASESNQNPLFAGEGFTHVVKPSPMNPYSKPSFNGYQDVESSLTNPSTTEGSSQRPYEEMHYNSSPLYQNHPGRGLEMAATTAAGMVGLEMSAAPCITHASGWISRPVDNCDQWSGELGFLPSKSSSELRAVASESSAQGLSLSLSPVLPTKTHVPGKFGEDLHSGTGIFNEVPRSETTKLDNLCSNSKPSVGTANLGNACQDMVGSSHRGTGPLGPFTGYATILKASKFLRPAQQLLDEICRVTAPKPFKNHNLPDKFFDEGNSSHNAVNAAESTIGTKGGDSGMSSSSFYGTTKDVCGEAGVRGSSVESYQPEYQQKKARLMFMQEEICRRYKQYHQQMQMVVSSFETVSGLSAATPYMSLALKTVSRHFRCLKNAISNQLKQVIKALGEDLSSPTTGASSSKGDPSASRLKFMDQSLTNHKSGLGNLGFVEPQQHVWRPQRGLPERSVAILRAWLFEHFLHPYPTDTDKHMLATKTGLSRNQVSNWFINARVRVWKPMVEEIHMLETKGFTESNSNVRKIDRRPAAEGGLSWQNDDNATGTTSRQVESSRAVSIAVRGDGQLAEQQWNQEKRSRLECQIPAGVDGSLMGFMPYQRSGLQIGGLGAVSLTLGLRQSAESAHQQQLQHQDHQLRQHFGGQMFHDFVG